MATRSRAALPSGHAGCHCGINGPAGKAGHPTATARLRGLLSLERLQAMKLAACLTAVAVSGLAACAPDTGDDARGMAVPGLAGLFAVHDGENQSRDDLFQSREAGQRRLA